MKKKIKSIYIIEFIILLLVVVLFFIRNLSYQYILSVIGFLWIFLISRLVYKKKTQRARVPAVPPLFAPPSQEEPCQVHSYPGAVTGVPGDSYSTLVVFQFAAQKGNSEHRPPLPCTIRQLSLKVIGVLLDFRHRSYSFCTTNSRFSQ